MDSTASEEVTNMRAVVHDTYGPPEVLRLDEVERPTPKGDDVLVRVHATTVTRSDCGWRKPHPFFSRAFRGIRRPKYRTLGMEFAGEVEEVGSAVQGFEAGDRVFGVKGYGANAEYVCIREERGLAHMPAGFTFEAAAAGVDGGCIALECLRRAGDLDGKRIVVYGASGSIGTAAVQLAKHFGAHVTAVCNGRNVEIVRSLGADAVIDYEREDFTKNGQTYEVVLDAVGKHSFRRLWRSLESGGRFVETDLGFMWHVPPLALGSRWIGSKRVTLPIPKYSKDDVLLLRQLMEAGTYHGVIDRQYPLEDVVEATRYVETGQKTGNVVLTVS
jgi:NADPH:quinone reductase-like Zn-dependent oxidoreductase